MNVRLEAIVNDSSSALLARAYLDPKTRMAVILGTGVNAAIHIPVDSLGPGKFSSSSARQMMNGKPCGQYVLTNTELSMFGKGIFPTTRWDEHLNATHLIPDYQPYEYLIAGAYISELTRLIMAEAASSSISFDDDDEVSSSFWGGNLPHSLKEPYTLDCTTLAKIDIEPLSPSSTSTSPHHHHRRHQEHRLTLLHATHPSSYPPTPHDLNFIHSIIHAITTRSIAFFATGVHALVSLMDELDIEIEVEEDAKKKEEAVVVEGGAPSQSLEEIEQHGHQEDDDQSEEEEEAEEDMELEIMSIGCDGSIINKYPRYMSRAQNILDSLWEHEHKHKPKFQQQHHHHHHHHHHHQTQDQVQQQPQSMHEMKDIIPIQGIRKRRRRIKRRRRGGVNLEKSEDSAVFGAAVAAALALISAREGE